LDGGARVKSPARVRARGCEVVFARSPGHFCVGRVAGGCDGHLTRPRCQPADVSVDDGVLVGIFRIKHAMVRDQPRRDQPRRDQALVSANGPAAGALRVRDPLAPRTSPRVARRRRVLERPGVSTPRGAPGGANPGRSHRTSTRTQIGPGPCTQIEPQWTNNDRVARNASTSCCADSRVKHSMSTTASAPSLAIRSPNTPAASSASRSTSTRVTRPHSGADTYGSRAPRLKATTS
jgi:hypothetical protein